MGVGFSCGGLGCAAFQASIPEALGVSELGYSTLVADQAVGETWDTTFAGADGTEFVSIYPVIFALQYLGGSFPPQIIPAVDSGYYGLGGSVPEPGALALVCAGLMGTFAARRRAQRQA